MKREIVEIICPYCKMYKLFKSKDEFSIITWKCPKCIHTFSYGWFDMFHQYEKFITRK